MSVARKRRRYLRWLRYLNAIDWQRNTRIRRESSAHGRAARSYFRAAPKQQTWLWVEMT